MLYSCFLLVQRFEKSLPDSFSLMLTNCLEEEILDIDSSCHFFSVMQNKHSSWKKAGHVIRIFKSKYSVAFWEASWTHHVSSHIHYSIKLCFMLGYTHIKSKFLTDIRYKTSNDSWPLACRLGTRYLCLINILKVFQLHLYVIILVTFHYILFISGTMKYNFSLKLD